MFSRRITTTVSDGVGPSPKGGQSRLGPPLNPLLTIGNGIRPIEGHHLNSPLADPGCHGKEICAKIGYNSACVRDISEVVVPSREFSGSGY